jgi:hypothetical protein
MTLNDINSTINEICAEQLRTDLAKHIPYFDCTGCVDKTEHSLKGMITLAKPGRQNKLAAHNHLLLHLCYLIFPRKYDVHAGYCRSPFSSKLIYRLACIGYAGIENAYGGKAKLDAECMVHQIKALLK